MASWIKRVKEEYKALIQVRRLPQARTARVLSAPRRLAGARGTSKSTRRRATSGLRSRRRTRPARWQGKVWTFHDSIKYEFDLEFDIPVSYPSVAPELALPELDGKTEKMYRGGKARATPPPLLLLLLPLLRAACTHPPGSPPPTRADLPRLALPAAVGAQRAALRHRARDGAGHGPVARGGDPVARRAGADQARGRKIMILQSIPISGSNEREIDDSPSAQLAGDINRTLRRRYAGFATPELRSCHRRRAMSAPARATTRSCRRRPGRSAPGPSFLDATDTTVIRIDDSPLVLPPSVDPDDDGPEPVIDERVPGESDDEVDDPRARRRRRAKRRARNHRRIIINMLACKYEVVAQAARSFGWRRASDDSEEFNILWADSYISFDTLSSLNKYQKANHFPGMSELAKKNLLAKNLNRLAKALPADFGFFPPSFTLPADLDALRAWVSPLKRKPTLIVKPDAGCQGKGIFLTKSLDDLSQVEGCVAQQYLPSPLLVDGYKFDMRLYVVVVSCSPLRVLLFKEGLARFCTEPYRAPTESNLGDTFMHLTNFAINKHHSEFEIDESGEGGSKRSLSSLMAYLRAAGYPADRIWLNIKAVIVKTLLAVQPQLRNTYHQILGDDNTGFSCFEILGFDILLDRKARPWLLEVNHAPSFACGSALDELIKRELMRTMRLLNPSPYHKKKYREELKREAMERAMQSRHTKGPKLSYEEKEQLRAKQKQNAQENWAKHEERVLGNFERIYPPPEEETPAKALQMYERVLAAATAIYSSGPGRRAPTRAPPPPPPRARRRREGGSGEGGGGEEEARGRKTRGGGKGGGRQRGAAGDGGDDHRTRRRRRDGGPAARWSAAPTDGAASRRRRRRRRPRRLGRRHLHRPLRHSLFAVPNGRVRLRRHRLHHHRDHRRARPRPRPHADARRDDHDTMRPALAHHRRAPLRRRRRAVARRAAHVARSVDARLRSRRRHRRGCATAAADDAARPPPSRRRGAARARRHCAVRVGGAWRAGDARHSDG